MLSLIYLEMNNLKNNFYFLIINTSKRMNELPFKFLIHFYEFHHKELSF